MTRKEIRSHVRANLVRLFRDVNEQIGVQYTDAEINDLINEASRQFLLETELLQGSELVTVTSGVGNISGNVIRVSRVEIDDEPVDWLNTLNFPEELPITDYGTGSTPTGTHPSYIMLTRSDGTIVYAWPNDDGDGWVVDTTPPS